MVRKRIKKLKRFLNGEMKLNPLAFGLTGGIISGLYLFFMTLITANTGYAPTNAIFFLEIYGFLGYNLNFIGALIGMIYAFVDGFLICWIFAWLYNKILGS